METNNTFLCSLERMTLAVVATTLWSKETARNMISQLNYVLNCNERLRKWEDIEHSVLENAKQIAVPEVVKCKLLTMIKPIGLEMLAWLFFHVKYFRLDITPPKYLCWTSRGTIDRKRTALMLIKDESLDAKIRYECACIYCLEDDILLLWEQIEESYKNRTVLRDQQVLMVKYWNCRMKKQVVPNHVLLSSPDRYPTDSFNKAFQFPDVYYNATAIKYLLHNFSGEERDNVLVDTTRLVACKILNSYCSCVSPVYSSNSDCSNVSLVYLSNVLLCLFSLMNEKHRVAFCGNKDNKIKCVILKCFLNWRLDELFMTLGETVCKLLDEDDFFVTLLKVLSKIECCDDYSYKDTFVTFWQQVPTEQRSSFSCRLLHILALSSSPLFDPEKGFKLIVRSLKINERQDLILYPDCPIEICMTLLDKRKDILLEFFLRECIMSADILKEFRRNYEEGISQYYVMDEEKPLYNKIFNLLDSLLEDKL